MSEANNIISLPSESKIRYNTLYLASKIVCKKDENFLVLFEFDIELLYGRYPNGLAFFTKPNKRLPLRYRYKGFRRGTHIFFKNVREII